MSEKIRGYTVALERDLSKEDAEALAAAIRRFKGVLKVAPIETTAEDWIAEERVRHELGEGLWNVLYPKNRSQ